MIDMPAELENKDWPLWPLFPRYDLWFGLVGAYKLDKYTCEFLATTQTRPLPAMLDYPILPKHLWQPFIATHNWSEIIGDMLATHPEMFVGTGPFTFVENNSSTLVMDRNPLYRQRMNIVAIHYEHSSGNKFAEGITVTALPLSTQIRPYKIKPSSWEANGEARLTIPITNLDTNSSNIIHEKIDLVRPGNITQILLDANNQTLAPRQVSLETFDLHNLEKGEHTISVTIEVTGGQLYDYVTANLPPELWQSVLGPKTVERRFWITTLADVNEDGVVNILDIVKVATRFGLFIGQPRFDTTADLNIDHEINILDIVKIALDYGRHY
jgi:hypothetical protein